MVHLLVGLHGRAAMLAAGKAALVVALSVPHWQSAVHKRKPQGAAYVLEILDRFAAFDQPARVTQATWHMQKLYLQAHFYSFSAAVGPPKLVAIPTRY